ncbi:catalase-3 [Selaginella moellendorffii]|uniref:catalase-3 n=1 Tax=Selaginella moellendorffii TaxID=88036 RepID=UPI000D1C2C89|nr:catalase-3 [Selaginella moellendorffii]|eukprot:XP_024543941.1 catalase-3 [Selaginella moellendorffii]
MINCYRLLVRCAQAEAELFAASCECSQVCSSHEGFMNFTHRDEEVNYFPSRFDPCRHAERVHIPSHPLGGRREKVMIEKENNFAQPGAMFRSWPADRQERFIARVVDALSDPRVTHEIRSIWLSYWSQADRMLGQKIATKFNVKANM